MTSIMVIAPAPTSSAGMLSTVDISLFSVFVAASTSWGRIGQ